MRRRQPFQPLKAFCGRWCSVMRAQDVLGEPAVFVDLFLQTPYPSHIRNGSRGLEESGQNVAAVQRENNCQEGSRESTKNYTTHKV